MINKIKLLVILGFALTLIGVRFVSTPVASGQTALSAPTGVRATLNMYNNKVGVYWDTMRGATSYRVFRNTANDPATAVSIANTPLQFFFDTTATAGTTFFYWVRAENASGVSAMSAVATGARSGTAQQGPVAPLDPPVLGTPENPMTAAKVFLGKTLFWDEQLSATKTVACGTCHRAAQGGSDPRSLVTASSAFHPGADGVFGGADDIVGSPGVPSSNADGSYNFNATFGLRNQVTGRKSPSHVNAAYSNLLFWDGRANGTFRDPLTNSVVIANGGALENQAAAPPVSGVEMGHGTSNWLEVATNVQNAKPLALATDIPPALDAWLGGRTYPELFQEVYGTSEVTPSKILMAIGSYERSLFSDQTPLDLANAGILPLPAAENRGRGVFGAIACAGCHAGALMTDNNFHNIGVRPVAEDTGRFQVTGNLNHRGQFRTPGLRNAGLRTSFMHNGRLSTLEDVVEFYNRGGDFPNEPNFASGPIQPRNLSAQQKSDLVAFLRNSLTDPRVANEQPPFDRPHLFSESNRVPTVAGNGVAGQGGVVPQPVAIEPPIVGNPKFTVGLSNARAGANALLVINDTDMGTGAIPPIASLVRQSVLTTGNGTASYTFAIPDRSALVGKTFVGRWYVTDPAAANGFSVTPAFRFTIFGTSTTNSRAEFGDFDGDGKADVSIFRPDSAQWWIERSSDKQVYAYPWGVPGDIIAPADYTGDGRNDIAIYRPSTGWWYILRSDTFEYYGFPFGLSGDVPMYGDFDGDGKADPALYRPSESMWFAQTETKGFLIEKWGIPGDQPQVGDWDGDGIADLAVYRPNGPTGVEWWVRYSSGGHFAAPFGLPGDIPVPRDYTGDGKTDCAVFRPSTGWWYILRSDNTGYYGFPFGLSGDTPIPADYDGDGKADPALFRASAKIWFIDRSRDGMSIFQYGLPNDQVVTAAYNH